MCHVPIKTRCLATGSDERQEIELPEVLRLAQKRKKKIFLVKNFKKWVWMFITALAVHCSDYGFNLPNLALI